MLPIEIRENKEVGKLLWLALQLHIDSLKEFPWIKAYGEKKWLSNYYDYEGKEHKDGALYINVFSYSHSDARMLISYAIIRNIKTEEPKEYFIIDSQAEDFKTSIYKEDANDRNNFINFSTPTEKVETLIDCLEFIGFRKEDVIKVIKGDMTARAAYQNIAPEEIKNNQTIWYGRKEYKFENNTAISGDYSGIHTSNFPWPFDETPILDCSKVKTSSIYCDEKKPVELINVNKNPNSISSAKLDGAIINEFIDASIVNIEGTEFGDQKVKNITKKKKTIKKKNNNTNLKIMSNAYNINDAIEALQEGADGIGLFRGETVLLKNPNLIAGFFSYITHYSEEEIIKFFQDYYEAVYKNTENLIIVSGNKDVVFRLTDIKYDELYRVYPKGKETTHNLVRGAKALIIYKELLQVEIKAILKACKKYNKKAKILIPYIENIEELKNIKETIDLTAYNNKNYFYEIGAMIENKNSVNNIDQISKEVNFISIGATDLTEDVHKRKRDSYERKFEVLTNSVKKCIDQVIKVAKYKHELPVNICGWQCDNEENLRYFLTCGADSITCDSRYVKDYINQFQKIERINIPDDIIKHYGFRAIRYSGYPEYNYKNNSIIISRPYDNRLINVVATLNNKYELSITECESNLIYDENNNTYTIQSLKYTNRVINNDGFQTAEGYYEIPNFSYSSSDISKCREALLSNNPKWYYGEPFIYKTPFANQGRYVTQISDRKNPFIIWEKEYLADIGIERKSIKRRYGDKAEDDIIIAIYNEKQGYVLTEECLEKYPDANTLEEVFEKIYKESAYKLKGQYVFELDAFYKIPII